MNEHIKQAALEAYRKEYPGDKYLSDDDLFNPEYGQALDWLRAWELATQVAYERAKKAIREEHSKHFASGCPWNLGAIDYENAISALANESSGKGK